MAIYWLNDIQENFVKIVRIWPKQVDKVNFLKMVKYNICPEKIKNGYELLFH